MERLRRGDKVMVIAGKDKGETGTILKSLPGEVIVEGLNMIKRHQGPRKFRETGIVEKEAPIDISNVMLIDPKSGEPTRVRFEADKKNPKKKVRIAVKSGAVIEEPKND